MNRVLDDGPQRLAARWQASSSARQVSIETLDCSSGWCINFENFILSGKTRKASNSRRKIMKLWPGETSRACRSQWSIKIRPRHRSRFVLAPSLSSCSAQLSAAGCWLGQAANQCQSGTRRPAKICLQPNQAERQQAARPGRWSRHAG